MKAYMYDSENNNLFKEEVPCQKDPKESEIQGKDVWLLPANCTFEAPPAEKEGYVILFRDGVWAQLRNLKGTQYWLEGETYADAPHTMTEYGDLPEGASTERPEKPLDVLKDEKLESLNTAFSEWRSDGATLISSLGFEADADEKAVADVDGLVTLGIESTVFMDANNVGHELMLEQLKTLQKELIESGIYAYQTKWAIRDSINSAEDKEALEAIEIVFTPKDFTAA